MVAHFVLGLTRRLMPPLTHHQVPDSTHTGWPGHLLQDESRALFDWMASKPDALRLVRESVNAIEGEKMIVKPVAWTLPEHLGATTCRAHLWATDPVNTGWVPLFTRKAVDAALAAERERCAAICEAIADEQPMDARNSRGHKRGARVCAEAIRTLT